MKVIKFEQIFLLKPCTRSHTYIVMLQSITVSLISHENFPEDTSDSKKLSFTNDIHNRGVSSLSKYILELNRKGEMEYNNWSRHGTMGHDQIAPPPYDSKMAANILPLHAAESSFQQPSAFQTDSTAQGAFQGTHSGTLSIEVTDLFKRQMFLLYYFVVQQQVVKMSMNLRGSPVHMTCPYCHADIMTKVTFEPGALTHLAALGLCFICICVACVPYFMKEFKNASHECPECGKFLGLFKR